MINKLLIIMSIILLAIPSGFAGTWIESEASVDAYCSALAHVMCSEYSDDSAEYDVLEGWIPYHENDVLANDFCAISYDDVSEKWSFGFISANNLSDLKTSGYFLENPGQNYVDGVTKNWDENCNADEIFARLPNNKLDYSRYNESGVVYSVQKRELISSPGDYSNVDDFDIITTDCDSCGANIQGQVTSRVENDFGEYPTLSNVTVTLYFKNSQADFTPYLTFKTDSDGRYSSKTANRSIVTYFRTYENISKIPKTNYVLIAKSPFYEDYIAEVPVFSPDTEFDFSMQPYGVCEPDCTYEGSNLCRKECDGRNGCEFPVMGDTDSLAEVLNLLPRGTKYLFNYSSSKYLDGDDLIYEVDVCEDDSIIRKSEDFKIETKQVIECPEGKSSWTSERLVKYEGQVVKMLVTYCK